MFFHENIYSSFSNVEKTKIDFEIFFVMISFRKNFYFKNVFANLLCLNYIVTKYWKKKKVTKIHEISITKMFNRIIRMRNDETSSNEILDVCNKKFKIKTLKKANISREWTLKKNIFRLQQSVKKKCIRNNMLSTKSWSSILIKNRKIWWVVFYDRINCCDWKWNKNRQLIKKTCFMIEEIKQTCDSY